jgi:hypothetical protein
MVRPEQIELLCMVVEADRNVPPAQRQPFFFYHPLDGNPRGIIEHRGLATGACRVHLNDLQALHARGFIALQYDAPRHAGTFDVRSPAFTQYERLKRDRGQPLERLNTTIQQYLSGETFQRKYPITYSKWVDAETRLWATDATAQLTTIGHLCREAMQAFASALIEQYQPVNANPDPAKTVARLQAVVKLLTPQLGTTEAPFLDVLIAYWGTVSDLVQRQEHGAQKEGQPLVWEDARRVVFQTVVVMFEVDSALSRRKAQ